jgi:hypothetical protein
VACPGFGYRHQVAPRKTLSGTIDFILPLPGLTILAAIGKIAANHARNSRTTESGAISSCAPVKGRKSQPGRNSTTDVDHDMLVIHTREGHRRNSYYPCSGITTNSRDSFLSRNGSKNSDVFARILAPEGQHIVNMPKEQFWSRISFVRCEKCC